MTVSRIHALAFGACVLLLAACGGSSTPPEPPSPAPYEEPAGGTTPTQEPGSTPPMPGEGAADAGADASHGDSGAPTRSPM